MNKACVLSPRHDGMVNSAGGPEWNLEYTHHVRTSSVSSVHIDVRELIRLLYIF